MRSNSLAEFQQVRGRGTTQNPEGRFEKLRFETDPEAAEDLRINDPDFEGSRPETIFFKDDSQSIISRNTSPDIGFDASLNPYRGCEHGCAYCYARPYHEYLGFSAGLDFETRIMAKENAPDLLRKEMNSSRWIPQSLACSGVTDCYQPVEKRLEITRSCLKALSEFRNPVAIITKNHLVTRDIDYLQELAHHRAGAVVLSITTLDKKLAGLMEPRASTPQFRLRAIRELTAAGVPVGVSIAPIIPGLNDHEIPSILEAAREQGASFASYSVLRLPHGIPEIFLNWVEEHFPDRRDKIEGRIRELRGGKLNETQFGSRMKGEGGQSKGIRQLYQIAKRKLGFADERVQLSSAFFRRVENQLRFF